LVASLFIILDFQFAFIVAFSAHQLPSPSKVVKVKTQSVGDTHFVTSAAKFQAAASVDEATAIQRQLLNAPTSSTPTPPTLPLARAAFASMAVKGAAQSQAAASTTHASASSATASRSVSSATAAAAASSTTMSTHAAAAASLSSASSASPLPPPPAPLPHNNLKHDGYEVTGSPALAKNLHESFCSACQAPLTGKDKQEIRHSAPCNVPDCERWVCLQCLDWLPPNTPYAALPRALKRRKDAGVVCPFCVTCLHCHEPLGDNIDNVRGCDRGSESCLYWFHFQCELLHTCAPLRRK
jgi:hypothetical protein